MRKRNGYRPELNDELETRVVLSHGGFRNPSVLLSGLTPRAQSLGRLGSQSLIALTNKAFDSFVQDYTQARGAYLSTLNTPSGKDSNTAFQNYTQYRVALLAQQIVSTALMSPLSNSKQSGTGSSLRGLVSRKINGTDALGFTPGTLGNALINATPSAMASAPAAALDSLAQDQAIEAARVGVINGLNIIKNGDFGNSNHFHKK
jgi:hypothetical protein